MQKRKRKPCRAALLVAFGLAASHGEAAGKQATTLPPPMTGAWGWSAESCVKAGDDGRIIVADQSVAFSAALYRLQAVAVQQDGAVRGVAWTNEEGEVGASRSVIILKLLAPDRLSVRTEAAGAHVYIRCAGKRAARLRNKPGKFRDPETSARL